MLEEKQLIQPIAVERDEYGFWTHPAWPSTDEVLTPYSWFDDRGLDIKQVEFEYDASETLQAAWYHDGTADCTGWNPTEPPGDGWFIFSIHDTEDGPICVWVRHKVQPGPDSPSASCCRFSGSRRARHGLHMRCASSADCTRR